jgi:hypothetical protein
MAEIAKIVVVDPGPARIAVYPGGARGLRGDEGKRVEFQKSATHLQWRFIDAEEWTDLVALVDITGTKGDDGKQVEFQKSATHVQWRFVGSEAWADLVALGDIAGTKGDEGKRVEFQTGETHLQWRYVGDQAWTDLVALSEITGLKGDQGPSGMTFLGSITTVSGTSRSISNLDLTPYKFLWFIYQAVSFTSTGTYLMFDGVLGIGSLSSDATHSIYGEGRIELSTGFVTGHWDRMSSPTVQAANGVYSGMTSYRSSSTTITFSSSTTATFDGGEIRLYGLR